MEEAAQGLNFDFGFRIVRDRAVQHLLIVDSRISAAGQPPMVIGAMQDGMQSAMAEDALGQARRLADLV